MIKIIVTLKTIVIIQVNTEELHIAHTHVKRICKGFQTETLGEYQDLYVQRDTLLLADVFKNFWDMCLKTYELNHACFLTATKLIWQGALFKKKLVKLDILTDIDMLLMAKKDIRGGIGHAISSECES